MIIPKSQGYTRTENLLAKLCGNTFLELWSYPNPFNSEKKELCDLIAVFENNVFIFFDRENLQLNKNETDLDTNWRRWHGQVIERQIRTASGAANYLRKGGRVYLDQHLQIELPIEIDPTTMVLHKIIVAHGAREACLAQSPDNIYGSLGINYAIDSDRNEMIPFMVTLDKHNPVHIFDSHNLPIILRELDTFWDFTSYLTAKTEAIERFDFLSYCGEEDLLAHYYHNYDEELKRHFIGTKDLSVNAVSIGEGEWLDFEKSEPYRKTLAANEISYLWDALIQHTSDHILHGRTSGENAFKGEAAITYMAKEPRLSRRTMASTIANAINAFPSNPTAAITRNMSYMTSFYPDVAYIFLQVHVNRPESSYEEYRAVRRNMLEIACGMAKNTYPNLKKVIGIATEPPKISETISEDFIVLDCTEWNDQIASNYEKDNQHIRFFRTNTYKPAFQMTSNFPT